MQAVSDLEPRFTGFDITPYPDEVLTEHINYATSLGLGEVTRMEPHGDTAVIVGSGPSVRDQINKIKRYLKKGATLFAVKGAHDYLMERGLTPDIAVAMDPRPTIGQECYRLKNDSTFYIVASQVHPELIRYLYPNVVLCHCKTALVQKLLPDAEYIDGGCTTGLRTILLAHMFGYRDIRLFGFDSCHTGKLRKVTGETKEKWKPVEVQIDGKSYWTDEHFAQQATELPTVLATIPDTRVMAHGPGLIPQILRGPK